MFIGGARRDVGGVKLSGYGREGGIESLEAYTVAAAVTTRGAP
jgi:succinate-semialdehyde dehydrogenase/glutarate-semialdehyde dehydrogenase